MTAQARPGFVLGIHPTSRGLAWTVFEGPFAPHDWGNAIARGGEKNRKCLEHVEKLVSRFEPDTIVLEAFEKRRSARASRIAHLGRAIVALATDRSIEVAIYSRGDVKACFASVGAVSRQEIAEAVARSIPALAHRIPKPRKPWESDDPRMALFSAAALVLTHYQYRASQILDGLFKEASEADED